MNTYKFNFLIILLFVTAVSAHGLTNQMTYAKSINVHSMNFTNTPVIEIIHFLRDASVQCCPNGNQINLVLNVRDQRILGTNSEMRVTARLNNLSFYDALVYLADAANLDLRFDDNAIVLSDKKEKAVQPGSGGYASPVAR